MKIKYMLTIIDTECGLEIGDWGLGLGVWA